MTGPEALNYCKADLENGSLYGGRSIDNDAGYVYVITAILAAEDASALSDSNPWRHLLNRIKVYSDAIHKRVAAAVNHNVVRWDSRP